MYYGATAIGQAMSSDTTITASYVFNLQTKGYRGRPVWRTGMPRGIAAPFYYTHKKRKTSPAGTRGDYYYLNSWRNDTLTILICGNCLHYCGYTANSTCS